MPATTNSTNNVNVTTSNELVDGNKVAATANKKAQRKAKQAAQQAVAEVTEQHTTPQTTSIVTMPDGSPVVSNAAQDTIDATINAHLDTLPEDTTPESNGNERKHGPFLTEEQAINNPHRAKYIAGKKVGQHLGVYEYTVPTTKALLRHVHADKSQQRDNLKPDSKSYAEDYAALTADMEALAAIVMGLTSDDNTIVSVSVYYTGMNYQHASHQGSGLLSGRSVSLCGEGKGRSSAVATANARASEAEQRAAAAQADLIAAKQVADSQRTANVLRMVAMAKALVANGMNLDVIRGTMDNAMWAEVQAGLQQAS